MARFTVIVETRDARSSSYGTSQFAKNLPTAAMQAVAELAAEHEVALRGINVIEGRKAS